MKWNGGINGCHSVDGIDKMSERKGMKLAIVFAPCKVTTNRSCVE